MKKKRSVLRKRGPKKAGAKRASLPEKDELFRLLTEFCDEFVSIIDCNGRRLYASPSYQHLLGTKRSAAGSDAFLAIHPEDREGVRSSWEKTLQTGKGSTAEYRLMLPDGSIRHFTSKSRTVRTAGKPDVLLVVANDVTDRRESERSQRLLAQALSCTLDCFCLTDLDNNFIFVNPAFCATYGYDKTELIGKNISMIRSTDTPSTSSTISFPPRFAEAGTVSSSTAARMDR